MKREINVSPWNHITTSHKIDQHTLDEIFTILIEKEGEYFYIVEESQKVYDISQMPLYIKEDWINYNKKPLNIPVLNQMIKSYENQLNSGLERPFSLSEPSDEELENLINLLKSLRRDLIINKVI